VFFNSAQLGSEYQNDVFVGDINNGNLYRFKPNAPRTGFLFSDPALADLVADDAGELVEVILSTKFGGITDLKVGPDCLLTFFLSKGRSSSFLEPLRLCRVQRGWLTSPPEALPRPATTW
jgi:hypothetical protein